MNTLCIGERIEFGCGSIYSYRVQSSRDIENTRRVRDIINIGAIAFGRSTKYGHITSTAFIVDGSRTHALMMHHRKLDFWLPPGGHCDGDNDVLRVARREAKEETGLSHLELTSGEIFDIDIHTIPANASEEEHLHFDIRFMFEADRSLPTLGNAESTSVAWIDIASLPSVTAMQSVLILKDKLEL
ncbi:NUDIX hydrolase [Rhizobium sp. CFBP 8762]|uniref:NUDIX hydrolase n=1 Tax=Rhizobium sp. CFBP 8762 TaxID=2775279 RepID=UPI00177AB4F5|nr:NUDIX hydrolase [Rhizobium sp. CFBP 8762]MBD8555172.1 NUDIX hydrolase [Rhizobium sp. CFBP 8762]